MGLDELYFDAQAISVDIAFIETLTLTKSTRSGRPEKMRLLKPHRRLVANVLGWKRDDGITREAKTCDIPQAALDELLCPYCKKPVALEGGARLICAACGRSFRTDLTGGARIYSRAYFSVSRKNAKSQIAAAIGLCLLILDGEASPEIYIAAKDRDQAGICYSAASAFVDHSDDLRPIIQDIKYRKELINRLNGGILRALSSDGKGKHGYNPSAVIIDEFHVWGPPEQELYDAMTSGSAARRQPLTLIITTAGIDEYTLCGREYEVACKVRDGVVEDVTYFPLIYELPKDADWADENLWHLANPTIGDIVRPEYLRDKLKKALLNPREQTAYRRLHCNQWVNSRDIWMTLDKWDACLWDGSPIAA